MLEVGPLLQRCGCRKLLGPLLKADEKNNTLNLRLCKGTEVGFCFPNRHLVLPSVYLGCNWESGS